MQLRQLKKKVRVKFAVTSHVKRKNNEAETCRVPDSTAVQFVLLEFAGKGGYMEWECMVLSDHHHHHP